MTDAEFSAELVRCRPILMRTVYRYFRGQDREDVVQTTLMNAWAKRADFRGDCALATWLYLSLRNTAITELRKIKVREGTSPDHPAIATDPHRSVEEELIERSRISEVLSIADGLRDTARSGILSYINQTPLTNTVKSQRYCGVRAVRAELGRRELERSARRIEA